MRVWETPVPIPNTTVKTQAADGTALETMWESRWAPDYGDVAQLGEHLPCKQGVESSNLSVSTESRQNCFDSKNREWRSVPVEIPRIAKQFLEVTCEASYMVP